MLLGNGVHGSDGDDEVHSGRIRPRLETKSKGAREEVGGRSGCLLLGGSSFPPGRSGAREAELVEPAGGDRLVRSSSKPSVKVEGPWRGRARLR
jgi:hypothetical protein